MGVKKEKSFLGLKVSDVEPLLKGAGIAALGAVLTYLSTWVSGHSFGAYTPVVVMGFSVLVNAVRKAIY